MTDNEKIARVQVLLGNDARADSTTITAYLAIAADSLLDHLYPFGVPSDVSGVPSAYEGVQCELAARYFARRGGLGETFHIENGIHRDWYSSDDRDLLSRVVPYGKVM